MFKAVNKLFFKYTLHYYNDRLYTATLTLNHTRTHTVYYLYRDNP